jgi:hypothetical protein
MKRILLAAAGISAAVILLPAAGRPQASGAATPAAIAYVNHALGLMQQHSINTRKLDWTAIRNQTLAKAAGAQTTYDTYDAIRFAIKSLHDRHSFLQLSDQLAKLDKASHERRGLPAFTAGSSEKWPPSPFIDRRVPEGHLLMIAGVRVAQIVVPMPPLGDDAQAQSSIQSYANAVEEHIEALAKDNPRGWIIDLRGNLGGNMWPMLAGIAPLLDAHEVGGFVDAYGKKSAWFIDTDGAGLRNPDGSRQILSRVSGTVTFDGPPVIAVLVDHGTASSGEAIGVALEGQPRTRFFGRPTHGQTTANEGFQLPDGANLVLATGLEADRTGKVYPSGITPDVVLPEQTELPSSAETDQMLRAAAQWIASMQP